MLKALAVLVVFCFNAVALPLYYPLAASAALPPGQKDVLKKNIPRFDVSSCAGAESGGDIAPGEGSPEGTSFPNLDPGAMARGIDEYIKKVNSNSKMKGLGETIVKGAENSNINPFLIVSIARKESVLSDPNDYNVKNGNNSFGRTATSSQPNFQGARTWYKWTSVEASLDPDASENKNKEDGDIAGYIRNSGFYDNALRSNSIAEMMTVYAPEFENDTAQYVREIKSWTKEMIKLTEENADGSSSSTSGASDVSGDACCLDESTSTNLPGRNNEEKIWNYLVSELKFNDKQAAGIMGNIEQESGFSPTAVGPAPYNAYGFAQWVGNRQTNLKNFAQEKGKNKSNLGVQLEFLKKELEGDYKTSVYEPIKNADSIAAATRIWLERFEVPCFPGIQCDPEMNKRLPMSQNWYNKFSGGQADNSSSSAEEASGCSGGSGESTGELDWPLPKQYALSSCYGQRNGRLHSGVDISAPRGTSVKAADGGEVVQAGAEDPGGFGNTVIIKHSNGLYTLYAHLKDGSIDVRKGQNVGQGDKIAEVNNTGHSYGDHLHFNVQTVGNTGVNEGNTKDPLKHLPKDGRARSGTNC